MYKNGRIMKIAQITPISIKPKLPLTKGVSSVCNNFSSNQNDKITNQLSAIATQNHMLIGKTSFKGTIDNYSFEEFNKARIKAGINTISDLEENIKEENLLGTGANSCVYSFNDKSLSKWAIKVDKTPFEPTSKSLFNKTDDEFEGINAGQEIAQSGDRYRILKKIEGNTHSIKDWSYKINGNIPISQTEALQFVSSLYEIANFPQSTFDDYANQLKILGDKGYKQDSINPNNILVNSQQQKLHIIDTFKADNEAHVNSRLDLINVLLDFSFFDQFYNQLDETGKTELLKSAQTIIEKCNIASKKANLPQDEATYLQYLKEVDKWFGIHLVEKGGDYRTRYERMKELIQP